MADIDPSKQDVPQNILACIHEAQSALDLLEREENAHSKNRIAWLESQLAHLVAQLKILLDGVENNEDVGDGSFWTESDVEEMVDDSIAVIANLKSLIQTLKALGR